MKKILIVALIMFTFFGWWFTHAQTCRSMSDSLVIDVQTPGASLIVVWERTSELKTIAREDWWVVEWEQIGPVYNIMYEYSVKIDEVLKWDPEGKNVTLEWRWTEDGEWIPQPWESSIFFVSPQRWVHDHECGQSYIIPATQENIATVKQRVLVDESTVRDDGVADNGLGTWSLDVQEYQKPIRQKGPWVLWGLIIFGIVILAWLWMIFWRKTSN